MGILLSCVSQYKYIHIYFYNGLCTYYLWLAVCVSYFSETRPCASDCSECSLWFIFSASGSAWCKKYKCVHLSKTYQPCEVQLKVHQAGIMLLHIKGPAFAPTPCQIVIFTKVLTNSGLVVFLLSFSKLLVFRVSPCLETICWIQFSQLKR